ncbi:MAG: hypothetical protein Kow00122_10950 [Thermoleophilia bacterium]
MDGGSPAAGASAGPGGGAPTLDRAQEERLVEAARRGDERAVEALYRAYHDTIYRYALYRAGSAVAAEDITSQVFLGMVRGLPRFRWRGRPFLAWLYAIAQKQVAHHHRTSARDRGVVDLESVGDPPDPEDPHESVVDRERRRQLVRALRMLPETQREVVLLRYVLSLSLAETAAAVDKSEGAVKQLLQRGLATLRDVVRRSPA